MFKFLFGSHRTEYVLEDDNGSKRVMQREEGQTALQVNGEDYVVNMVKKWHENSSFSSYRLSDGKYSVVFIVKDEKVDDIYFAVEKVFEAKYSNVNVANLVWLWNLDGDRTGKLELSVSSQNSNSSNISAMQMSRELSNMLSDVHRSLEWMEVAIDHALNN